MLQYTFAFIENSLEELSWNSFHSLSVCLAQCSQIFELFVQQQQQQIPYVYHARAFNAYFVLSTLWKENLQKMEVKQITISHWERWQPYSDSKEEQERRITKWKKNWSLCYFFIFQVNIKRKWKKNSRKKCISLVNANVYSNTCIRRKRRTNNDKISKNGMISYYLECILHSVTYNRFRDWFLWWTKQEKKENSTKTHLHTNEKKK